MDLAALFETLMILGFGVSWPFSIAKSWRSHSTSGKSLVFMSCILFGYGCGIASKLLSRNLNLAFWFYIPNAAMVLTDILIYLRNRRDQKSR